MSKVSKAAKKVKDAKKKGEKNPISL